ncbi:ester cyclase [Candidatus Poribacteria bacterium]|nr:ester cyclase [Candidatus Poribacteria bacterium]
MPEGIEGLRAFVTGLRQGMPDAKFVIDRLLSSGDYIGMAYRLVGTHTGEFMGIPATGRKLSVTGIDLIRFKDGKAVEHWGNSDDLGMMRQLGVMPAMGEQDGSDAMVDVQSPKDIGEKMKPEAAEALVRSLFDKVMNGRNVDAMDAIIAPGWVTHVPGPNRTKEGVKARLAGILEAFPDLKMNVEFAMVDGDSVLVRWSAKGTNTGPLMGMEPTGKAAEVTGITIARIGGGMIHENWENWDEMGMMMQLGLIPPMDGAMSGGGSDKGEMMACCTDGDKCCPEGDCCKSHDDDKHKEHVH